MTDEELPKVGDVYRITGVCEFEVGSLVVVTYNEEDILPEVPMMKLLLGAVRGGDPARTERFVYIKHMQKVVQEASDGDTHREG